MAFADAGRVPPSTSADYARRPSDETRCKAESADQQIRDRLNVLATTQTQAQLQEVPTSDQPAEVLYDVEIEEHLAAYATGPAVPELSLYPCTAPTE